MTSSVVTIIENVCLRLGGTFLVCLNVTTVPRMIVVHRVIGMSRAVTSKHDLTSHGGWMFFTGGAESEQRHELAFRGCKLEILKSPLCRALHWTSFP